MTQSKFQNTLYQQPNRLGKLMANHVNLMFDIETTGTKAGCCVLQIAAVPFNNSFGKNSHPIFESIINWQSCKDAGLVDEPDTLAWWQNNNANTVSKVFSGTKSIRTVFEDLYLYCKSLEAVIHPWGNAASFDLVILRYVFDLLNIPVPWDFRNEMCFRTLKNLFPLSETEKPVRFGPAHDAFHDAMYQVRVANTIFNKLHETLPYAHSPF